MIIERLDAWIFSVTECLQVDEKRGGGTQSNYVALWAKGELILSRFLSTDGIEERKESLLKMDRTETGIVVLPTRN